MGRSIGYSVLLRLGGAGAWLAYIWTLTRILTVDALGEVLYILVLAGFLAALISAGWAQMLLREGSRYMNQNQPDKMASIISYSLKGARLRSIIIIIGVTVAYFSGLMPSLISTAKLATLTIAISVVLAIILLLSSAQRACGNLIKSMAGPGVYRAVIPLGISSILTLLEPVTSIAALSIHLAALCVIAGWLFTGLPKKQTNHQTERIDRSALHNLGLTQIGYVAILHLDVLILGWVTGPIEAGIYLIARRISGLLNLVFDALRNAYAPSVSVAFLQERQCIETATKVNRMFLITGSITGLCLILFGHYILQIFGATEAMGVYFWLLLANGVPAIFGATGFLMMMANMERLRLLFIATLLPFGIIILLWAGKNGVYELAMAYALLQLSLGACGAVALQLRHNIYPSIFMIHPSKPTQY